MDDFFVNRENFSSKTTVFPAGKGVNVAKAIKEIGSKYALYVLLGRENADKFEQLLRTSKIDYLPFYCDGKIRENISIHAKNIKETRICSNEFNATNIDCAKILEEIDSISTAEDIIVFSGRLPTNISSKFISKYLSKLSKKGCRLIIDSASFTIDDYKEIKPYLIKPNECEISIFGDTETSAIKSLLQSGVENIALSKGEKGIEYVNNQTHISITPPSINALSTVGAGDSSVAGFAYALSMGFNTKDSVKFAVACGSACCLTDGGMPPNKNDIMKIFHLI
jgi:1-phosphofructokinase family hexose kinase